MYAIVCITRPTANAPSSIVWAMGDFPNSNEENAANRPIGMFSWSLATSLTARISAALYLFSASGDENVLESPVKS